MKSLAYKDIHLIPKYSELVTRDLADTTTTFLGREFRLPVVPANMASVINFKLADELADNGYFYILHRFYETEEIYKWIETRLQKDFNNLISVSVGVKESDERFLTKLRDINNLIITVDIAHGYSLMMRKMIKFIKKTLPQASIIAGNVAGDSNSVAALQGWGANAIKVGIGPGAACTTYDCTGFCSPMFSAGKGGKEGDCLWSKVSLIGDGGIRNPGDIAKALVAGYDMVMIGSLFAACKDSPANQDEGSVYGKVVYSGSASKTAKHNSRHIEGKTILLDQDFNHTYLEKMDELKEHLQSAISYAGGKTLKTFKYVEYNEIANS